jgi:hypothetical protein
MELTIKKISNKGYEPEWEILLDKQVISFTSSKLERFSRRLTNTRSESNDDGILEIHSSTIEVEFLRGNELWTKATLEPLTWDMSLSEFAEALQNRINAVKTAFEQEQPDTKIGEIAIILSDY